MISSLQRLLLEKYDPTNALLKPPAPTPVQKASSPEKAIHVVMSSADFDTSDIEEACHAFNLKLSELPKGSPSRSVVTSSHVLLADFNGIPKGSWIVTTTKGVSLE